MAREKRYLILADGSVFEGFAFGADGDALGEVVFATGMTGYIETLTDPSYYGQIVIQTFPLIGNYGMISQDMESKKPYLKGYIVREWCQLPSNFRSEGDIDTFLRKEKIPGLYGLDTRSLTRRIREHGVLNGIIANDPDHCPLRAKLHGYTITDAVKSVTRQTAEVFTAKDPKYRVVLMDFGAKNGIVNNLTKRGCEVTAVPADTSAKDIIAMNPDGIMLTNGPGDPAENTEIIKELGKLAESGIPLFGICLGHQLLALAHGAKTEKLHYGHRGANHPVKVLGSNRVYITSQNHGYAVVNDSLPEKVGRISHINVNDGTCEGIIYSGKPVFSVQFHPEACGGPLDTGFLFDDFIKLMRKGETICR